MMIAVAVVMMMHIMTMAILVMRIDAQSDADDAHHDASGTDLQRAHV